MKGHLVRWWHRAVGWCVVAMLVPVSGCRPQGAPSPAPVESASRQKRPHAPNRAAQLKSITFFADSPQPDVLPTSLIEASRNAKNLPSPGPVKVTENQHAVGSNAIFLDVDFDPGQSWFRLRIPTGPGAQPHAFDARLYRPNGFLHFFLHGDAQAPGLSAGLGDGRKFAAVPVAKFLTLAKGKGWHDVRIPVAQLPFDQEGVQAKAVNVFYLTYQGPARRILLLIDQIEVLSPDREPSAPRVRINQLGYLPGEKKIAKVAGSDLPDLTGHTFSVRRVADRAVMFHGELKHRAAFESVLFGEEIYDADFSEFRTPGYYFLEVAGYAPGPPFLIDPRLYDFAWYHAARFFYLQRSGQALPPAHAGPWARGAAFNYPARMLHRPDQTVAVKGGVFDGGDSRLLGQFANLGTLMFLCEMCPDRIKDGQLNIPESGNGIPDVLDLVRWHIEFLLSLQDPRTGGNFSTVMTGKHRGEPPNPVRPYDRTTEPRYVYDHYRFWDGRGWGTNSLGVTTRDTAAACAVYAAAARLFAPYAPDFADRCKQAALRAWKFLRQYPRSIFRDVGGASYVDISDRDERLWAAAELWRLTGKQSLQRYFVDEYDQWSEPSEGAWRKTWDAAWMTYALDHRANPDVRDKIVAKFVRYARRIVRIADDNGFGLAVHAGAHQPWGGLQEALRNAVLLLWTSYLTGQSEPYEQVARNQFHYICGCNVQRFSYITHFGRYSAANIYHPYLWASGVSEAPPGYLVWGPRRSEHLMSRYIARRYRDSRYHRQWSEAWFTNQTNLTFLCGYFSSGRTGTTWPLRAEQLAFPPPTSRPAAKTRPSRAAPRTASTQPSSGPTLGPDR